MYKRLHESQAEKFFRFLSVLAFPFAMLAPNADIAAILFFGWGIGCISLSVFIGVRRSMTARKYLGTHDAHKYSEWKRKPFSNKDLNINHSGLRGPSGEGRESLAL